MTLDDIFGYWKERGWRIIEFEFRTWSNRPDLCMIGICSDSNYNHCYAAHGETMIAAHLLLVERVRSGGDNETDS